jgi:hypothetical protein
MERSRPDSAAYVGLQGLKCLVTLVAAAMLIWFVVVVTMGGVFRERVPEWALGAAPFDARAQANLALRMLTTGSMPGHEAQAQARILATSSLRRDPTIVEAVATLGLGFALGNDIARAERAFLYANHLSLRDIPSQLWLIERNVQRNDIRGALSHFDPILRTSPAMHPTLLPILTSASTEPAIADALNQMLRSKPNWGPDFISALLMQQGNPVALYRVTRGLLSPNEPREKEQLTTLLRMLTQHRAFDLAWRAYVAAQPERLAGGPGLWNGDFAHEPELGPFDWGFPEAAALTPERRLRDAGGFALFLPTGATTDTETARQLIHLPAGRYIVTALVGNVAQDEALRPRLTISCAAVANLELARTDFPFAAEVGAPLSVMFTVPANCNYQWLSLWVRGAEGQSGDAPWIAAVRVAGS